MPLIRSVLLVMLLVAACAGAAVEANAQKRHSPSPAALERFAEGMRLFEAGRYAEAQPVFAELRKGDAVHERTTAAFIMGAKTELALRRYESVAPLLFEFFQRFPESRYQPDAYYTLGMTSYVMHNYVDAGRQLVHCIELAKDTMLLAESTTLFELIADRSLSAEHLRELYASTKTALARDLLKLKLAEKVYAAGEPSRARIILDDTLALGYFSKYAGRIAALRLKTSERASITVGAILPLMRNSGAGAVKILAEEVLEGMTFALDEAKASGRPSAAVISLDARDIGRDSAAAVRGLRELLKLPETIAVIGPLFSNIAFFCAPIAQEAGVALISPTATSNGLAELGQYVFQANPDFATRGKAMAIFAARQLGLRRVAVLAPYDGVGRFVAESFIEESRRLGMTVITAESYPAGVGDLRDQCMSLRRAASTERQITFAGKVSDADMQKMAEAGASRRVIDSLRLRGASIGARQLLGPRGEFIADSLKLPLVPREVDPEDVETPMTEIQGLFIPVTNADEMGLIAPQIAFYNIKTQLLGSNEWYDPEQLNEHKRSVNGVMFVSDTYVSPEDPAYAAFDSAYVAAVKKHPTKYSLYGYDTMKLVLDRIEAGATGRRELAKQLGILTGYPGVHSKITFAGRRVNSELHVLQFYNGRVSVIGDVTVH